MQLILREHLYVQAPGPYRAQMKRWATFRRRGRLHDGEKRLIRYYREERGTLWLPRGLFPYVRALDPTGPVVDHRFLATPVTFPFLWALRDYQDQAIAELVRRDGGVVESPPASGKTIIGLGLAARWRQPTLWLVHTLRLADQALANAHAVYGLPESAYGLIADSREDIGTHFTVATIQTLVQRPRLTRELTGLMGTVIADECHHLPSSSFSAVISQFPARYKAGLSATPRRTDGLGPMIPALVGQRVVVPRDLLRARGIIMDPMIRVVESPWRPPPGLKWAQTEKLRAEDTARNVLIARAVWRARVAQGRVLVLVERKRHAAFLAKMLQAADIPAFAVTGDLPPVLQDRYFAAMEQGRAVAIATQLANEGLNWPRLDWLVLAAAASSTILLEQRNGRVARAAEGKSLAVVVDIMDSRAPGYQNQVAKRLAWYQDQGLRVRRWQP